MSKEKSELRGVSTQYGAYSTGRATGIVKTEGANHQMVVDLTGEALDDFITPPQHMPDGATVTKAYVFVEEVFDLTAASVVEFGEAGAEATNGVSITEAILESEGYTDLTSALSGTWAVDGLTDGSDLVGLAFSAGGVSTIAAGKAKLVIEYTYL